ncbi:MAG: glutamyl-tRNA reductase [Clostridiales bacterium]|nr:glutamyl-tRNA reductase [Clostridiales bacterium]
MGIEMIGIDHSTAEIDVRMMFSFTKKNTEAFYTYIKKEAGIDGCVLLSTCCRTELWVSTSGDRDGNLYDILCRIRGIDPERFREYFIRRKGEEAVRHLFRLACGLESRILGEDQILTQVGDALAFSRKNYAADHVLETLFRQAVTAGKKVKTNVDLSHSDPSVAHVMIRRLKQEEMSFREKTCLVIGNGAMGKLAAVLLLEQGADVWMTVRRYHGGLVDIPADCKRIDYGRRMELIPRCDYVVSATASPNYTLTRSLMEPVLFNRGSAGSVLQNCGSAGSEPEICTGAHKGISGQMVLVDLAVPRDIDPEIGSLPGVRMYDVDSFRKEARSEEQKHAIREAEEILSEQMDQFFAWYDCVDMIPLIEELKHAMAADLSPRISVELRRLPLEDTERCRFREDVEAAAERAANKLLFGLRDTLDPQTFRECLRGMRKVYGNDSPGHFQKKRPAPREGDSV